MRFSISALIAVVFVVNTVFAQNSESFKLKDNKFSLKSAAGDFKLNDINLNTEPAKNFQLKTRKTVTSYFGAGYSFMIFTNKYMSDAFPVLDTRNGSFLTNINLFFGFAIAKAVTLELSPSILFTSNNRQVDYTLSSPYMVNSTAYNYAHTYTNGIIAIPIVVNVRFFPMFKRTDFARLFFIGGGVGTAYVREENDVYFNNTPNTYFYGDQYKAGYSTSQWTPLFKAMTGFTGSGGQFGFGGELSYNFVPLKQDMAQPFATRFAKDMNSVDITLRFYFSL